MTFTSDLRSFHRKAGLRADQIVRKVTLDMTADLVKMTPVDTGLAKNSYFFGAERLTSMETALSKSGSASLNRAADFTSNLKAGGIFYITNNLPYIMALEYGHSQQAPAGMARITVDRWQQNVYKIAASLL